MTYSASDIAAKIGGAVEGDAAVQISRLASLTEAKSGDLSFLSNKKYADQMASTKASLEKGRTMPDVPMMEMPSTMPNFGLNVRRASSWPPGTEMVTSRPPA